MTKKYLADPFNALYQDDFAISSRPEIQEINEYALGLEDKIAGDFNLDYITFEFAYNRLAYVRNGLLLAKLKFMKLYKNFGDGTFATFCREQLKITRWQINDNIKAARVCMELIYAGFDILPTNISQAVALASLAGDELVHAWRIVIESIEPDKITHKSIRSFLFPPSLDDLPTTTIKVTPTLHESIHREAADRGMTIVDLIKAMFEFFITGGNSHLFKHDINTKSYAEKAHLRRRGNLAMSQEQAEQIWREDLANLVAQNEP